MKDYKELTRKEFNKEAVKFDHASGIDVYSLCKNSYDPLLEEVKKEDFENLLDVGCGTGNSIERLQKELPKKNYVGIDLAKNMIVVAKKKRLPRVKFLLGDAEHLPFEDEQFDVIICKESFHHYPNVEQFFSSAYRVLKPGGRLILLDMTMPGWIRWLENHFVLPFIHTGDVHIYGIEEVKQLYRKAGFKVERADKVGRVRFICTGVK